jgi:hypothetical protein
VAAVVGAAGFTQQLRQVALERSLVREGQAPLGVQRITRLAPPAESRVASRG